MPATQRSFASIVVIHALLGVLLAPCVGKASVLKPAEVALRLQAYEKLTSFRTRFTQTKYLKEVGVALKSDGELVVHRPDQVIWTVKHPAFLKLTLSPTEIHLEQGEGAERREQTWKFGAQISGDYVKGIRDLVVWLKLDVKAITETYTLDETKPNELTCTRKIEDKLSPFKSMRLKIGASGHLEKLFLDERSGDLMELTFAKPEMVGGTP